MNPAAGLLPVERFVKTLHIVWREGGHLSYSWRRLFPAPIDAVWVAALAKEPEAAEQPGSQIDTLNRAEQLQVLVNVNSWLEARKLRNRLVHEYMEDPEEFAEGLNLASRYSLMLMDTYNRVRDFALHRMGLGETTLPALLDLPASLHK